MSGFQVSWHLTYERDGACLPFPRAGLKNLLVQEVQLLEQVRAGSTEALGELYTLYREPVYQLAYRLTLSESDAGDVLQDVFVELPRALGSYREQGKFAGWLSRLTTRTALQRLRSTRRRKEEGIESAGTLASRADEGSVERIALRRALQKMPESLRAAFVLKEIEGYSHVEIARLLGTTPAGSMKRLSRAWKFLRKEVGSS